MIVYRVANEPFKDDLSGEGAAMYGGRWNSIGVKMLYTSKSISLTILETLVHLRMDILPPTQYLLSIDVPEKDMTEISVDKIKPGWHNEPEYTQWIGDQFILTGQFLMLMVPSVIIPQEKNVLINPQHKNYKKVKIISSELLQLDKRLI